MKHAPLMTSLGKIKGPWTKTETVLNDKREAIDWVSSHYILLFNMQLDTNQAFVLFCIWNK